MLRSGCNFITLITFVHITCNLLNPHATHQFINFLFNGHILGLHCLPGALQDSGDKNKTKQNTSPWPCLCWGGKQVTKQLQFKWEECWWRYEQIATEGYRGGSIAQGGSYGGTICVEPGKVGVCMFTIQAGYGEDTSGRRMASAKAQRCEEQSMSKNEPSNSWELISEVKIKVSYLNVEM